VVFRSIVSSDIVVAHVHGRNLIGYDIPLLDAPLVVNHVLEGLTTRGTHEPLSGSRGHNFES
jgi:hypothetical protein